MKHKSRHIYGLLIAIYWVLWSLDSHAAGPLPEAFKNSWKSETVQRHLEKTQCDEMKALLEQAERWSFLTRSEILARGKVLMASRSCLILEGKNADEGVEIAVVIRGGWVKVIQLTKPDGTRNCFAFVFPGWLRSSDQMKNGSGRAYVYYQNGYLERRSAASGRKDEGSIRWDEAGNFLEQGMNTQASGGQSVSASKPMPSPDRFTVFLLALGLSAPSEENLQNSCSVMLSPDYLGPTDMRDTCVSLHPIFLEKVLNRTSNLSNIDPIANAPFLAQLLSVHRSLTAIKAAQTLYARPEFSAQLAGACGLLANGAFDAPLDENCIFARALTGPETTAAPTVEAPVHIMAAIGLGASNTEAAAALLIRAIETPGRSVLLKRTLLDALGENASRPARAALHKYFDGPDQFMAAIAFRALLTAGEIGHVSAAIDKAAGETGSKPMQEQLKNFADGLDYGADGVKWREWWEKARVGWPQDPAP